MKDGGGESKRTRGAEYRRRRTEGEEERRWGEE